MALSAGDSGCTSGLSGAIYSAWTSDANNGFSSPLSTAQQTLLKAMCYRLASAIVSHITSNAVVSTTGADPQGGTVTSTGTVS
jgi:hypothetical protein